MKRLKWMKIPLLLLLLAYLLRIFSLDWQSFWIDEAHAFYYIDKPFMETAKTILSPGNNGPLYFLLLWIWRRLTGPSDFAIRYLSALCSVLTVAILWRIARTWFDKKVAAWSGLLLALAPFAIWYAQEAKMYALHMFLAALTTLILIKALHKNSWPHWLAYGISINLLAYSHFFGALAIAAQGIITLITTWKAPKRRRAYLITMVVVALPYLPIIQFALKVFNNYIPQGTDKNFVPLVAMLRELGAEYTLRTTMLHVTHPWLLLAPLVILLLIGLAEAWRKDWKSGLWVSGMFVFPIAAFYIISFKIPIFAARYLSATFPFFIMVLALALERLRRWWKPLLWVGLSLMLATTAWANIRILSDPEFQRPNWSAAAEYLENHARPDDVIIGFAHYATRNLNRYYTGETLVNRFQGKPYEPEIYYTDFRDLGKRTLWLTLHYDQVEAPNHRLLEAAGAMFPNITGIYPNNGQIAILGYSMQWHHETLPANVTASEAHFENGMRLVGYHVDATTLPPTDNLMHPPSNWIHVTTYWQVEAGSTPDPDFTPFVRLIDAQNGVWGGELQRPPTVFHFDPPAQWPTGSIVEAHYDVNLNPVTPPGEYRLIVGLEREDGSNISLLDKTPDTLLRYIQITK